VATNPVYPEKPEQTEEEIPVVRINDLTVLGLPDGAADIIVEGSEPYVVLFEKREVFGFLIAVVRKGHNIFVPQDDVETPAYFIHESEAARLLSPGITAATGPIVVPPRGGPRMPQFEKR